MAKKVIILIVCCIVIFSIFILIFQNKKIEKETKKKINVMVSILPQIDFVKNIGGDKIDVQAMILPGFSPATYEPSPNQLKKLSSANLYIRVGHIPFEKTQMEKLKGLNPEMKVIDSSKGIKIYQNDPHIWMSPKLVKIQVRNICNSLLAIDSANKIFYENNEKKYLAKVDNLDIELRKSFSKMQHKKIFVFHPAFGYLAREYGFEQISVEIEGKEPSAKNLAEIIDKAKKENIKIIFVQRQFSAKSAGSIAKQINGKVVPLDPLAEDYINNLRIIAKEIQK
ncbi:zinc ABC transporter substrate-binding protein [bacterium]|nr:zinc ABC transporter substrate-binding protein [bacterium]